MIREPPTKWRTTESDLFRHKHPGVGDETRRIRRRWPFRLFNRIVERDADGTKTERFRYRSPDAEIVANQTGIAKTNDESSTVSVIFGQVGNARIDSLVRWGPCARASFRTTYLTKRSVSETPHVKNTLHGRDARMKSFLFPTRPLHRSLSARNPPPYRHVSHSRPKRTHRWWLIRYNGRARTGAPFFPRRYGNSDKYNNLGGSEIRWGGPSEIAIHLPAFLHPSYRHARAKVGRF